MPPANIKQRFQKVRRALEKDGFRVIDLNTVDGLKGKDYIKTEGYLNYENCLGVRAEHKTATTGDDSNNKKKAYYIEGDPYQMGFLMGLMAEREIETMSVRYVDNVIPEIINLDILPKNQPVINYIKKALMDRFGQACIDKMENDVPEEYQDEIEGIVKGCETVNPNTGVNKPDLWSLNFGIDLLFAYLFTGAIFKKKKIPSSMLRVPVMCNAFSLYGDEVVGEKKHFFGRDFMFMTAGVFQDVACMVIYNPEMSPGKTVVPFVAQTAPGFVGSIAAMNNEGVAMGVDVLMSGMCDPDKPGFNSLGLVRDSIQHGPDMDHIIDRIAEIRRGVSWIYPVVDGQSHEACFIEAGMSMEGEDFPYFYGIPKRYCKILPEKDYILEKRGNTGMEPPRRGMLVRRSDYQYPVDYIHDFNEKLWKRYSKDTWRRLFHNMLDILRGLWLMFRSCSIRGVLRFLFKELPKVFQRLPYDAHYFEKLGYINPLDKVDRNCPGPYYFAPQREENENLIIVTNHAITPEMRLTSMADWIAGVSTDLLDDFQWRYDELNSQLHRAIERAVGRGSPITDEEARNLIDFLRPNEDNPSTVCRLYYNPGFKNGLEEIPIEGSISLFELNSKTVWSRFGYYSDEWIRITLPNYV
jgi:hypothetical protein